MERSSLGCDRRSEARTQGGGDSTALGATETPTGPSRKLGGRRSPLLGRNVLDMLRERPAVPFWILSVVAAVAIPGLVRLGDDRGTGSFRVLEMRVDIVHVDVYLRPDAAGPLRALVVRARVTHHDQTVGQPHLGVSNVALGVCVAKDFAEAEGSGEEVKGARNVLVQEVRADPGVTLGRVLWHGAEARPPGANALASSQ